MPEMGLSGSEGGVALIPPSYFLPQLLPPRKQVDAAMHQPFDRLPLLPRRLG
jgi:hypothetical protein